MIESAPTWASKTLRSCKLGRNFWIFRLGQVMSQIGDNCRDIALSWWVLEKTGSAAQMAAILTPAMMSRLIAVPLLGPLADRIHRRNVMALSDGWRCVVMLSLAACVAMDYFNIMALIALQIFAAFGTALADTSSRSIIPQIVPNSQIAEAIRVSEIARSLGSIAGGIVGGLVTSFLGIKVSFLFDALTFAFAAFASLQIRTEILASKEVVIAGMPFKQWTEDLRNGTSLIILNRGLLGIACYAMLLNFFASPLMVALPVLVKEARQMPVWFLGALESAMGVGSIVGVSAVWGLGRKVPADILVILGITMVGLGMTMLPFVPTIALPVVMTIFVGFGVTLANLPMVTQLAKVIPDSYRGRVDAVVVFLCGMAMPIGTALSSALIEQKGLSRTLCVTGLITMIIAPIFRLVPGISSFMLTETEKDLLRP